MCDSSKPLAGKAALIAGGSRGIGAGIARRLAADGANIALTYANNATAAEATVKACREQGVSAFAARAHAGDVALPQPLRLLE